MHEARYPGILSTYDPVVDKPDRKVTAYRINVLVSRVIHVGRSVRKISDNDNGPPGYSRYPPQQCEASIGFIRFRSTAD